MTTVREALNGVIRIDQQLETLKLAIQVCPDSELEKLFKLKLQLQNHRRQQAVEVSRLVQEEERQDRRASATQRRQYAERQQAQTALAAARELLYQHQETRTPPEDERETRRLHSPVARGPEIWAATEHWTDHSEEEDARTKKSAPVSLAQEKELRV